MFKAPNKKARRSSLGVGCVWLVLFCPMICGTARTRRTGASRALSVTSSLTPAARRWVAAGRQPVRQPAEGAYPRCLPSPRQWPTGTAAPTKPTTPRRVGRTAGRTGSCRALPAKASRAVSGSAATAGWWSAPRLVQPLPPPAHPLRAAQRHLRGLHQPHREPHHTQPNQTVLLGAPSPAPGCDRRMWNAPSAGSAIGAACTLNGLAASTLQPGVSPASPAS
ncbi:hypothetical protein Mchl_4000 [Methylorubrum extorquens CM4]|uniref:Uncharacterized protein n=1 Tax=Methylorubrum extorquens (strain CM4 / NCIMB 13688) TaxID=440085 RepID=B7KYQ3_METC4|nr:hypothetical protein Mchl_4000 [Methylorubrum extorquens CM4]